MKNLLNMQLAETPKIIRYPAIAILTVGVLPILFFYITASCIVATIKEIIISCYGSTTVWWDDFIVPVSKGIVIK